MDYFSALKSWEDIIVLDVGSKFIRAGFAGEETPREIFPNQQFVKNGNFHPLYDQFGHSKPSGKWEALWNLEDFEVLASETAISELQERLTDSLDYIFKKKLLKIPSGKRVIVCENVLMSVNIKGTIEKVLKERFRVESVFFVDSSVAACFVFGCTTGISVSIGNYESIIIPVVDGRPIMSLLKFARIGGFQACRALGKDAENLLFPDLDNKLIREAAKSLDSSSSSSFTPSIAFDFLTGDKNDDGIVLAKLIIETIQKCPIDVRKDMAKNILVFGGCAALPNFRQNLMNQLEIEKTLSGLHENLSLKIPTTPFPRSNISWISASLVSRHIA